MQGIWMLSPITCQKELRKSATLRAFETASCQVSRCGGCIRVGGGELSACSSDVGRVSEGGLAEEERRKEGAEGRGGGRVSGMKYRGRRAGKRRGGGSRGRRTAVEWGWSECTWQQCKRRRNGNTNGCTRGSESAWDAALEMLSTRCSFATRAAPDPSSDSLQPLHRTRSSAVNNEKNQAGKREESDKTRQRNGGPPSHQPNQLIKDRCLSKGLSARPCHVSSTNLSSRPPHPTCPILSARQDCSPDLLRLLECLPLASSGLGKGLSNLLKHCPHLLLPLSTGGGERSASPRSRGA